MSKRTLLDVVGEPGPVRWYKSRLSGRIVSLCAYHARQGTRSRRYAPIYALDLPRFFRERPDRCSVCTEGTL